MTLSTEAPVDAPDTMDAVRRGQAQQQQPGMTQDEYIVDEDPLLIAQSLTYVTDDGSVVLSFQSAPFSWCKYEQHWNYTSGYVDFYGTEFVTQKSKGKKQHRFCLTPFPF